MTKCSTSGRLGNVSWVQKATAVQKECATPPHVHPMSRYVIARDQFYQAFPRLSTASDKRWGKKTRGTRAILSCYVFRCHMVEP